MPRLITSRAIWGRVIHYRDQRDQATTARRMLAIALVLEGVDRTTAAQTCGMDRQTLRDWVHRYNAEGIEGLSNRRSAGPTPLLNSEQKAELAQIVRDGPDPEADGVVRWRRVDLQRKIKERFGIAMHEGWRKAGLDPVDRKGMVFNPVLWRWSLSARDLSVNYVTTSVKR